MEERKVTVITRQVPESIRRDLKSKAAAEGKSMQEIIIELMKQYISKK